MKAKVFSLILVLIGTFVFLSCNDYAPKGPVTIEIIEGRYLILKQAPFDTIANVIFLDKITYDGSNNYFWKRKVAGEYKTISLSWENYHSLKSDRAYVILDTIKPPLAYMKFADYRKQGLEAAQLSEEKLYHEQLIDAYFHPQKTKKIGDEIHFHFNPTGTVVTKIHYELTIKYNPVTKSFVKAKPTIEEKTGPSFENLIILIIFIIATFNLAKAYNKKYSKSEIKKAFWILLIGTIISIKYSLDLREVSESIFKNIVISIIIGAISSVIYRISLLFKNQKTQKIAAMILLPLISLFWIGIITEKLTAIIIPLAIIIAIYLFFIFDLQHRIKKISKKIIKK